MQIARILTGPHHLADVPPTSGTSAVLLTLQGYGVSVLKQNDLIARIAPGQLCLCDPMRPYTIRNPVRSQRLALLIPRDRFDRRMDLAPAFLRTFKSEGSSRVLSATLMALVDELTIIDGARASVWADCIIQMLQLAIRSPTRWDARKARFIARYAPLRSTSSSGASGSSRVIATSWTRPFAINRSHRSRCPGDSATQAISAMHSSGSSVIHRDRRASARRTTHAR